MEAYHQLFNEDRVSLICEAVNSAQVFRGGGRLPENLHILNYLKQSAILPGTIQLRSPP